MSDARHNSNRCVRFNNKNVIVKGEKFSGRVVAAVDEPPGDWKTALARGIKGIEKGQHASVSKIWFNLYGEWATIRVDGEKDDIDVRPYNLILQDEASP